MKIKMTDNQKLVQEIEESERMVGVMLYYLSKIDDGRGKFFLKEDEDGEYKIALSDEGKLYKVKSIMLSDTSKSPMRACLYAQEVEEVDKYEYYNVVFESGVKNTSTLIEIGTDMNSRLYTITVLKEYGDFVNLKNGE